MTYYRFRFDFEIGNLVKSPCRECERRSQEFPRCIDACELLERIHALLAQTRSCSRQS